MEGLRVEDRFRHTPWAGRNSGSFRVSSVFQDWNVILCVPGLYMPERHSFKD